MDRNQQGSALIWVLMLFALLAIMGTMAIKSALWAVALQQSLYEKECLTQFAQGAFDCAMVRAKRDFETICKNKKILSGTVSYQGRVVEVRIEPLKSALAVSCSCMYGPGKPPITMQAEVIRDSHNQMCVRCFQR